MKRPTRVDSEPAPTGPETLLKAYLKLTGTTVTSLSESVGAVLSRGAIDRLVNGQVDSHGATLVLVRDGLNALLERKGRTPVSLEGLRYLASFRPAPSTLDEQLREIQTAQEM